MVYKPAVPFLKKHLATIKSKCNSYYGLEVTEKIAEGCAAWMIALTMITQEFVINDETKDITAKCLSHFISEYISNSGWFCTDKDVEFITNFTKTAIVENGTKRMKMLNFK